MIKHFIFVRPDKDYIQIDIYIVFLLQISLAYYESKEILRL